MIILLLMHLCEAVAEEAVGKRHHHPNLVKIWMMQDALGNRVSMTDANGATTNYVYDDSNRLVTIDYPSD
jgi:YD repeat-containing protein